MYQPSYFFGDFSTYPFKYVNKTCVVNVDFIPEWNPDACLHDSNSIFHSGSSVETMSWNSIRIHVNKYNSISYGLNRNGIISSDSCSDSCPDWVSVPNDTSNSIRVYMGEWVEDWKSHSGLKLVSDSCTNNLIFPEILALIHLNTSIKLLILQTIFISAIMNVDFIPSLVQEWNFDPSSHDSESTFHSGSSV